MNRLCVIFPLLLVLLAASARADEPFILFPAGRTAYIQGEELKICGVAPANASGNVALILASGNGPLAVMEETISRAPNPQTLSYTIFTEFLAPGSYAIEFRVGERRASAVFVVVAPGKDDAIALVLDAPPVGPAASMAARNAGYNTVLIADAAEIDGDALARANLRWMRELILRQGISPADQVVRTMGAMHAQTAAQAAFCAPGFSGMAITDVPELPAGVERANLLSLFSDDDERAAAALALLFAATGKGEQAQEHAAELKPSQARRLLDERLTALAALPAQEGAADAVAEITRLIDAGEEFDLSERAGRVLDTINPALCSVELVNPFADEHLNVEYRKRFGSEPPQWWLGNENWLTWERLMDLRSEAWKTAFDEWAQAVRRVEPQMQFVTAIRTDARHEGKGIVSARGTLGFLQPLFEARYARVDEADKALWMRMHSDDATLAGFRAMLHACLAAGIQGIIYDTAAFPAADRSHRELEISSFNRTVRRHADILSRLKPRARVGILKSRTSNLHELGENPLEQHHGGIVWPQPGKLESAWALFTLAGHVPNIIFDEHVGTLDPDKVVLVVPALNRIQSSVLRDLHQFIRSGGTILIEKDSPQPVRGATELPLRFPDAGDVEELGKALGVLRSTTGLLPAPAYRSEPRNCLIVPLTDGRTDYLYVMRPAGTAAPVPVTVSSASLQAVAYDVFAGKEAAIERSTRGRREHVLRTSLSGGQGKLFALTSQRIGNVLVEQPEIVNRELTVSARLIDENGASFTNSVSAEIIVLDESGAQRAQLHGCFESGRLRVSMPIGINEPHGRWFVRVTELFSGRTQGIAFNMPVQGRERLIRADVAVEVFNSENCVTLLRSSRNAVIVAGATQRESATQLARDLRRFAIQAEVKLDTDLAHEGDTVLHGDTIVIGHPSSNQILRRMETDGVIPAFIGEHYPGNGRALITYASALFHPQSRTIALISRDTAGLRLGAEKLFELARGRDEDAPRVAILRMPQNIPPMLRAVSEEQEVAAVFKLEDAVAALALPERGRFAVAGSVSGQVLVVNSQGTRIWQARHEPALRSIVLPVKASDPLVIDDNAAVLRSIVSPEKWTFPFDAQHGRITDAALMPDGRLYVFGTSGGVIAVDKDGKQAWTQPVSGKVLHVALSQKLVAAATASGITLLSDDGAPVWRIDFAGCTAILFCNDGQSLVAGNESGETIIISTSNGSIVSRSQHGAPIAGVISAADGGTVITAAGDVVSAAGTRLRLKHHVRFVARARDGRISAAASSAGEVSVFTPDGIIRQFRINGSVLSALAVSGDGRTLAAGDWNGTVRMYNIEQERQ